MKKILMVAMMVAFATAGAQAKDFDKNAAEIAMVLIQPEVAKCVAELVVAKHFGIVSITSNSTHSETTQYTIETQIPKAFKRPDGGYDPQTRILMVTKGWQAALDVDGQMKNEATYSCKTLYTQ